MILAQKGSVAIFIANSNNKTVVEVFADFLAYLLECASSFIQETHANGAHLWESIKDELIPDTTAGYARLSFVTEGEASLHYAVHNGLPIGVMEVGEGVVIVDAGGGTIDISSYSKNVGEAKHRFEEVAGRIVTLYCKLRTS